MADPVATKGKGSGLTRKVGPLPLWAWAAVAVVVGYVVYKHFQGASASSAQTAADTSAPQDSTSSPTSPADSGSGSGGGSGDSGVDDQLAQLLEAQMQADNTNNSQILSSSLGIIGSQDQLIGELAQGAQTIAQTSDQQLGAIAAAGITAFSNVAQTGAVAAQTSAPPPAQPQSDTPAYTPVPDTEPNPGAQADSPVVSDIVAAINQGVSPAQGAAATADANYSSAEQAAAKLPNYQPPTKKPTVGVSGYSSKSNANLH